MRALLAATALFVFASCSSPDGDAPVEVEPGEFCILGTLPFSPDETAWQSELNESRAEALPRIKHQPADLLGNDEGVFALTDVAGDAPLESGNLLARGVVARTKATQGFMATPIDGEWVSVWGQDENGEWQERGELLSDDGSYEVDLGVAMLEEGFRQEYVVLNAERSCGVHNIFQYPRGKKVILTDIDATITQSDDEIIKQIDDEDYDPIQKASSVQLTQTWAAKGYGVVYLTARPHVFRTETRTWLTEHGYAEGPVITAPELFFGEPARLFKGAWVSRVLDDLGWDIVAAYGNADSDIGAYEDAGLDKATTFIIGELAGAEGTTAIENDDYAAHIETYVEQQPDA